MVIFHSILRIRRSTFVCWSKSKVIYLMSITRGVLGQSPEPEAHDKVLEKNPDRIGRF